MKWWRHPIELVRGWWKGYDEPDWRTRLMKPFLMVHHTQPFVPTNVYGQVLEAWEYKWSAKEEEGWELTGIHPLHTEPGRKSKLLRRRIK